MDFDPSSHDHGRTPTPVGITGDDQILEEISVEIVLGHDAAPEGRQGAVLLHPEDARSVEQGDAEWIVLPLFLVEPETGGPAQEAHVPVAEGGVVLVFLVLPVGIGLPIEVLRFDRGGRRDTRQQKEEKDFHVA